ncbi:hypothetical protein [Xanthomonas oryzae]|uniref:hypothetical protein n=1 Tax=Xanthomonas oryzae TaxID=347 RepID=UPI001FB79ACF|nr:hypothetical protein [Xanthomonas oryzae]
MLLLIWLIADNCVVAAVPALLMRACSGSLCRDTRVDTTVGISNPEAEVLITDAMLHSSSGRPKQTDAWDYVTGIGRIREDFSGSDRSRSRDVALQVPCPKMLAGRVNHPSKHAGQGCGQKKSPSEEGLWTCCGALPYCGGS